MQVAYFVHDLTDPAVAKRVRMLQAGGAEVRVLGFRREDRAPIQIAGARTVDLGRTYDAHLGHRTGMVLQRLASVDKWCREFRNADVFIARNLEMLALANAARSRCRQSAGLVYECLDIHRHLLSGGAAGKTLRAIERFLMRHAQLLIVSSPAFVSEYFEPKQSVHRKLSLPVLLVENKPLDLSGRVTRNASQTVPAGPPWRIGWFGMIRCRKSLDILCAVARKRPDLLQVVIRGRPSLVEFDDFHSQVRETPGVTFGGAYDPSELQALYDSVHFNWAIDFFEAGGNSELLLPNRIYEGGRHAAVPLARNGTEIARWLKRLDLGVSFASAGDELEGFLESLSQDTYAALKQKSLDAPLDAFVADGIDCDRLVGALKKCLERRVSSPTQEDVPGGAESLS